MQVLVGFSLGIIIGYAAFRFGALTNSGAVAAAIVGGLIFGFGGFPWASLLLLFFISSSLLSRLFKGKKKSVSTHFSKGSQRDHGQVLANGGVAVVLVLLFWFIPDLDWLWVAFAGSMAAVNADTWATELGVLSPTAPRLIVNGKPVPKGTSGGVTVIGYLATLAGAGLIALASGLINGPAAAIVPLIIVSGLAGATVDSILGATIQGIYYCPMCEKETESSPEHHCGTRTTHLRGWHWVNNDIVNLICSLTGSVVAVGGWWLIR
jgi:uncharacterized protein (TIGR00297 family)